jgi:hypothetical protein
MRILHPYTIGGKFTSVMSESALRWSFFEVLISLTVSILAQMTGRIFHGHRAPFCTNA